MTSGNDDTRIDSLMQVLSMRSCRSWEDAHLPLFGTLLGRDFVLLLTQLYLERRDFSLKELYLSLPYSENAVRLHLQKLERAGWIALENPEGDRRFKRIRMRRKLQHALENYVEVVGRLTQEFTSRSWSATEELHQEA